MADPIKTRSAEETKLLERARQRLPGGVLGTSRYADDVGFVVKHGKGSKIYDVSGRLVKTVANRSFPGGQEHVVTWDGTNDAGNAVARGVYFYQLRSPSFTSQKKLAVLKN